MFTAEALLRNHGQFGISILQWYLVSIQKCHGSAFMSAFVLFHVEWSKEALLDSWMNDPRETCENAGVELPSILSIDNIDDHLTRDSSLNARQDAVCSICFDTTTYDVRIPCEHTFCGECWKQ